MWQKGESEREKVWDEQGKVWEGKCKGWKEEGDRRCRRRGTWQKGQVKQGDVVSNQSSATNPVCACVAHQDNLTITMLILCSAKLAVAVVLV